MDEPIISPLLPRARQPGGWSLLVKEGGLTTAGLRRLRHALGAQAQICVGRGNLYVVRWDWSEYWLRPLVLAHASGFPLASPHEFFFLSFLFLFIRNQGGISSRRLNPDSESDEVNPESSLSPLIMPARWDSRRQTRTQRGLIRLC